MSMLGWTSDGQHSQLWPAQPALSLIIGGSCIILLFPWLPSLRPGACTVLSRQHCVWYLLDPRDGLAGSDELDNVRKRRRIRRFLGRRLIRSGDGARFRRRLPSSSGSSVMRRIMLRRSRRVPRLCIPVPASQPCLVCRDIKRRGEILFPAAPRQLASFSSSKEPVRNRPHLEK